MSGTINEFVPRKATTKRLICTTLPILALVLTGGVPMGRGQTKEQIRTEAEAQLQKMTPAEIDQRLMEYGITRDEAIQKASEYGISLDEYLSRLRVIPPEEGGESPFGRNEKAMRGDPRLESRKSNVVFMGDLDSATVLMRGATPQKIVPVPGFNNRYGLDSLIQPFGREFFLFRSSFFAPSASAAPPPSYQLGPGDELLISVWGETRLNYQLTVNKEGNVVVPDVGPVSASGQTLGQFQEKLLKKMSTVYASLLGGARARALLDVSLGKLKTIQVFVMGEVMRPGGYAIPSMSTVLSALYAAGGPNINGGMRNIRIVRRGEELPPADLYEYLLKIEKSSDRQLMDGDIVFVAPATRRAAIVGEVIRPAIYDLKEGETLGDLIHMAGGPRFYANTRRAHVERIVPFALRGLYPKDVLQIDLEFSAPEAFLASKQLIEDGDVVRVYPISFLPINQVDILGPVNNPGRYELTPGMRVADLIMRADSLKRSTFAERGTVARLLPNLRRELIPFNIRKAFQKDEANNVLLQNEDNVYVYPDSLFFPERAVQINGAVRSPGTYLRRERMTIGDLIITAGGLTDEGIVTGIEVARVDTTKIDRYAEVFTVNLPAHYWKSGGNDFILQDYDAVMIPENPRFVRPRSVTVTGYVMSPGRYSLRYSNERLADLFKRAGGLRTGGYLEASRLFRKNTGMVPIDFKKALGEESSRDNIVLYDGDSVHVALIQDVVYVSGEVFVPSPVLYEKGADLDYYINQAGGTKDEADEGRTVVLLPGGKKWDAGGLFGGNDILPGSSVFVPRKIEKEDKTLPALRDIVTIVASLAALTVALIQVSK